MDNNDMQIYYNEPNSISNSLLYSIFQCFENSFASRNSVQCEIAFKAEALRFHPYMHIHESNSTQCLLMILKALPRKENHW